MRPSRVGPLEEKSARLSKAFFSGGAASKLAVSFPPAWPINSHNSVCCVHLYWCSETLLYTGAALTLKLAMSWPPDCTVSRPLLSLMHS